MFDEFLALLKTYDWGVEPKTLKPIDDAVHATGDDADGRKQLESQLAGSLKSDLPRAAKDYVCRKLMVIGTAASVPALAALLPQQELSHMARYALERIPAPEAGDALRDALSSVSADLQVGVISSLGVRQEAASVAPLAGLLGAADVSVARAAAFALGAIRSAEASKALAKGKPAAEVQSAVTDASLWCAEALLADGKKTEALMVYKRFSGDEQPKHVRLAATRGMLACAGKS